MAYALFLLVNAALFVRPGEVVPQWQGLEIYFYVIVACMLFALPALIAYLTSVPLETQPLTLCVFGLFICILIPPLLTLNLAEASRTGFYFAKVIVYYLLLVSLISTPARLRGLVTTLTLCCGALALVTIMRYFGFMVVPGPAASVKDGAGTSAFGEELMVDRVQGTGIFQDPNDLCVMLAAAVPWAIYLLLNDRNHLRRVFWFATLLLFGYAIYLTKSRGGLLGLMMGLGVCSWARFGLPRTLMLGAVGLPLMLAVFAGRQTTISARQGTGQTRIQLWSDWLEETKANLPFGMGMQLPIESEEEGKSRLPSNNGHLAHNAYLQAFADLGLVGGCLFLGMVGLTLTSIYRVGQGGSLILDPDQRALRPFLLAGATAYAVGIMTLSLTYVVPTFLMPALAVAYTRTTVAWPLRPPLRLDERMLLRFALAGACFLVWIYITIRLFVSW